VLFVAFDAEEAGCYGSKEFIASYVKPLLVNEKTEIQGAIILDTIFNYDSEENSQSFSQVSVIYIMIDNVIFYMAYMYEVEHRNISILFIGLGKCSTTFNLKQ
jgi:Zn-dependent M28 family amino/carboxypeptidase